MENIRPVGVVEYKITISKIEKDVPFRDKEYKITKKNPDENESDEYGYVYFDSTHDITTQVLEQTVEDLDMTAVIKSINGL